MSSKKYIIKEGLFNWLLSKLVGKDNNAKLRWYAAIKTDPKLRKLSKEFEKSAGELKRHFDRVGAQDQDYKDELENILKRR
tara:strand:- start:2281 stop:2523 length:243 start_codon:yes stop_codon:yes gene_type:complete